MHRAFLSTGAVVAVSGIVAGVASEATAASTPAPAPLLRTLKMGSKGPDVALLQRALTNAHLRGTDKPTGVYGYYTATEVMQVQRIYKLPVSGWYGSRTHQKFAWSFGPSGRAEMAQMVESRIALARAAAAAAAAKRMLTERTSRVMEAVRRSTALSSTMAYSQSWSRGELPAWPAVPTATDCSGYATWVLRHAGVNPGGHDYVGWTGTLGVEGESIAMSDARVGDLVFYGGSYPYGHVAVYIGNGMVASHGSPGVHVVPVGYRPVSAVRRYFS